MAVPFPKRYYVRVERENADGYYELHALQATDSAEKRLHLVVIPYPAKDEELRWFAKAEFERGEGLWSEAAYFSYTTGVTYPKQTPQWNCGFPHWENNGFSSFKVWDYKVSHKQPIVFEVYRILRALRWTARICRITKSNVIKNITKTKNKHWARNEAPS